MQSLDSYQGEQVREIVFRSISRASDSDTLVFLMGPYRLLDPSYLYPDDADVPPLPPDPLSPDPDSTSVSGDDIEPVLCGLCDRLAKETGVTPFIASEVDIPTKQTARSEGLDEPGMAVIDQSVSFARASDGNAFVFTKAGLTTGVGSEAGAIPEYFGLRSPETAERNPSTFCIFEEAEYDDDTNTYDPRFGSASIDEMDVAYNMPFRYFDGKEDLLDSLVTFVESQVVPIV
jgi:hypothetical protein